MLLATMAHRQQPRHTIIAHAVSPAVPESATTRVKSWAAREGWRLKLVMSSEFDDEAYLSNPVNRCYFCKSNLYSTLDLLSSELDQDAIILSGANLDDLGEYRPGLIAASENQVRHPFVEAEISKSMIRSIARTLELPFADLPASPCLASRLYTGTRVTQKRLRGIELAETYIREKTQLEVVRCRIQGDRMRVEVEAEAQAQITSTLLAAVRQKLVHHKIELHSLTLDPKPYQPGRAFLINSRG